MRQRESCENAKEFVVTSPHVLPHPIISRIVNVNPKREREHDTSRHVTDMSYETYYHAG